MALAPSALSAPAKARDRLDPRLHAPAGADPVEWRAERRLILYELAVAAMESRAAAIAAGTAAEELWLLEHPPLYTAGTSAKPEGLTAARFPIFETGRGGQLTYHGPGQRIAYAMLDLNRRGRDLRAYVAAIEAWVIGALAQFGIAAGRREERVGVWVERPDKPRGPGGAMAEDKIAAIGIRVRRWVAFHGMSLNVAPDLGHYSGIVPCGIATAHYGVTSLADLGIAVSMDEVDAALRMSFETIFGPTSG